VRSAGSEAFSTHHVEDVQELILRWTKQKS